jgi:hypothetical protein
MGSRRKGGGAMNRISMKVLYVLSLVIILTLTLGACGPDDRWDVSEIRVEAAEPISTIYGTEEFHLDNCRGTEHLSQSLELPTSVEKRVAIGAEVTTSAGVEVEIPVGVRQRLQAQVEASYQQNVETAMPHLFTINMSPYGLCGRVGGSAVCFHCFICA